MKKLDIMTWMCMVSCVLGFALAFALCESAIRTIIDYTMMIRMVAYIETYAEVGQKIYWTVQAWNNACPFMTKAFGEFAVGLFTIWLAIRKFTWAWMGWQ